MFATLKIVLMLNIIQEFYPGHYTVESNSFRAKFLEKLLHVPNFHRECINVCDDLPPHDVQPVCMMYSRYKRGYQYFVNLCHARRAICKDNLLLHMVHPNRCSKSNQFYMPVS